MTLPLHTYVAAVEAITRTPLPGDDILEAMMMRDRGITPEEFAYWLQLSASPSTYPPGGASPSRQDGVVNPLPVYASREGEEFRKERT